MTQYLTKKVATEIIMILNNALCPDEKGVAHILLTDEMNQIHVMQIINT